MMADLFINTAVSHPVALGACAFVAMWLAALGGAALVRHRYALDETLRADFGVVQAAALTLLGLIIGFTFSMATGRFDQRKNYEEGEANAIGTEYLRADLLPAPDADRVRKLLRDYLDHRIRHYVTTDEREVRQLEDRTAQLQSQLWSAVLPAASAQPTPVVALAVAGMNDVLNSQGYTQSAWRYRIPSAAWVLLTLIALVCNLMIGYGSRGRPGGAAGGRLLLVLPVLLGVAFMLIADIDAPRHGLIHVKPVNLTSLAESLQPQ